LVKELNVRNLGTFPVVGQTHSLRFGDMPLFTVSVTK
jgi:hypothetical protein